jgi:SNF2 family DNA or RNA helicase
MKQFWHLNNDGYIFSRSSEATKEWNVLKEQLDLLVLEDKVAIKKGEYFLSFDNALKIDEVECEELCLPSVLPYQIEIKTQQGDLGHNDFMYAVAILQPNGQPFINAKLYKGVIKISDTRIYRLNVMQQKIISLALESNKNIGNYSNSQAIKFNYRNLDKMGNYAKNAEAKLEQELEEKSNELIVPDKISIDFRKDGEDYFVTPVLWKRTEDGKMKLLKNNFNRALQEKAMIRSFYTDENGKKIVCDDDIKNGLQKIKDTPKLTKDEYERCKEQPKEIFDEEVFINPEIIDVQNKSYSDRVDGLTDGKYQNGGFNSGYKTDWVAAEGESYLAKDNQAEEKTDEDVTGTQAPTGGEERGPFITEVLGPSTSTDDVITTPEDVPFGDDVIKASSKVLNVKPNMERIDYVKKTPRTRHIDYVDALKNDVKLLPHQIEGVKWMCKEWEDGANGVLLADDMGLGKTLQAFGFVAGMKKSNSKYQGIHAPVLIVAPIALLKNWQDEYYKFVKPGIFSEVLELHGNMINKYKTGKVAPNGKKMIDFSCIKANDIVLTTYETLRDYQFSFGEIQWSFIIIDEAQKIKNPTAGITIALKAMKYDFAICLTGTPVENSWVDLWSIMDFAEPAHLGDLKTFKDTFSSKLKDLQDNEKEITELGSKLKGRLDPIFKRRMKKDHIKGLPAKTILKCPEMMPKYQEKIYINLLNKYSEEKGTIFAIIAKLRDVSLHPDLCTMQIGEFYEKDYHDVINRSARLIQTFKILKEIKARNEKVLIFVVSKKMQLILSHLIKTEFNMEINKPVNGEMNGAARQAIIDKFNRGEGFDVLILSPEAAGVGFTITAANNVIHLGRMWNPAKEDQATDRVYRIGQKKDVNVYIPIAMHPDFGETGSFDEKLDKLLDYKRTLSDNVLFPTGEDKSEFSVFWKQVLGQKKSSDKDGLYWNIEDVDTINGTAFEKVVACLYNKMPGNEAIQTPPSNDNGADVIVKKSDSSGLLIQCKQTTEKNNMGPDGVEAVYSSVNYYQRINEGYKFEPVVITNAADFTINAKMRAKVNGVQLIARAELAKLLQEFRVEKSF